MRANASQARDETAPGTELLIDQSSEGAGPDLSAYQHVKHGDGRILLVPQPSLADPNDPLRWPLWKKWLTFGNALVFAFNGAMTGPMMAGGMLQLSAFFNRPLADITYSNGATLICQGFGTLVWMPLAVKFGRRPVYLASNLLMGIACIWVAVAAEKTYPVFVLGRAFLGLWEAPIEAIVPSTVTDLFYLHERGEKISMYGLSVLGGNELGPLVSAYIIQALSMRWAFFIVAMFIGLNVVTMFFFMPETKFMGARPVISPGRGHPVNAAGAKVEKMPMDDVKTATAVAANTAAAEAGPVIPKKRYLQELVFCSVTDPSVNLWKVFTRPFILMAYPTVLWASLVYGMSLSWNLILGALVAQLFGTPPYKFASGSQGLIFLSPLIGSLVATYLCGALADRIATFFTIRNRGIREPEMRLPTVIVAAVLTFTGALISGLTYQHKTPWAGPIVGFGVLSAGAQMGATLAMSYALDCHIELSAEIMVTISCLKSAVAWIWTWCINDWVEDDGLLVVFMVIATLNVLVYASTLVFHFWGKRIRVWIHRKQFLE
ncbi:major facilitator superfamily domain-containing protein [Aspergillus recurvatus]